MPIRYAKDIVVDQATADLMSKAFNDALDRLRLSRIRPDQEPEWVRETLALRIIETVLKRGARSYSPARRCPDASGQGQAARRRTERETFATRLVA
jgi:hypothetical protein